MNAFPMLRAFWWAGLWKVTGARAIGGKLIESLGSPDANERSIAGMLLTRAGVRAEPLLEEALQQRESPAMVLTVMASIGDRSLAPLVSGFVSDADPQVAQAARDAMRLLGDSEAGPRAPTT